MSLEKTVEESIPDGQKVEFTYYKRQGEKEAHFEVSIGGETTLPQRLVILKQVMSACWLTISSLSTSEIRRRHKEEEERNAR